MFYIWFVRLSFFKGNICRKFAPCFALYTLKKHPFIFNLLCVLICLIQVHSNPPPPPPPPPPKNNNNNNKNSLSLSQEVLRVFAFWRDLWKHSAHPQMWAWRNPRNLRDLPRRHCWQILLLDSLSLPPVLFPQKKDTCPFHSGDKCEDITVTVTLWQQGGQSRWEDHVVT